MGSSGKIVRETKVASEPESLLQHFTDLGLPVIRVGLEAGPLWQWLRQGLVDADFEVVLLDTRHVKAAMAVKVASISRDRPVAANGLVLSYAGQICRCPSRAGPTGRPQAVAGQAARRRAQHRGIPRGYGLKVGEVSRRCRKRFGARIRDLIEGHDMLATASAIPSSCVFRRTGWHMTLVVAFSPTGRALGEMSSIRTRRLGCR